jgi:hypothetical protein
MNRWIISYMMHFFFIIIKKNSVKSTQKDPRSTTVDALTFLIKKCVANIFVSFSLKINAVVDRVE